MINIQHIRFGALTGVLLLSTVMLIPIDESQSSVFAQNSNSTLSSTPITPAPGTSDSGGELSSDDDSDNNDSNGESSGSSGSDDDGDNSSDDSSDSQQDATSSEDEEEEEENGMEDDFEQTNPLLEQIRNNVNGALSASGIAVP